MRILSIAFKDLRIAMKDRRALVMLVAMPILLIFVLGFCLSSMFKTGAVTINKFPVAIVNQDQGAESNHLVKFLKSDEIKKTLEVREMDEKEALDQVKDGTVPAAVVIQKGYSKALKEGGKSEIKVVEDPGNPTEANITESIVRSYTSTNNSLHNAVIASDTVLKKYRLNGQMILPKVMSSLGDHENTTSQSSELKSKSSISSMQYYSAAMLVMFIIFVAMMGTSSVLEEREQMTLMRLMSTSVPKRVILTGKLLGLVFIGIFDILVLILFTKAAFHVDWGNSIPGILILSAAMMFAASGFAMLIAARFKTSKSVNAVSPVLVMSISFLGGSMFPLFSMPATMQNLSKITFNNWSLRGYISLMMNNGMSAISLNVLVLLAMGLVFLTAGISKLKLQ